MSETTWTVAGMTCGHCVASVTEEIGEIYGVEHVDVVLATGVLTVAEPGRPGPRDRRSRRGRGRLRPRLRMAP